MLFIDFLQKELGNAVEKASCNNDNLYLSYLVDRKSNDYAASNSPSFTDDESEPKLKKNKSKKCSKPIANKKKKNCHILFV